MTNAPGFLQDLALVLCVAAVTTVLFHRLRQPPILGYLLAGLILGPHMPIHLLAHEGTVKTLSELGVILVMFSIGLEFTVEKLVKVLPTAGVTNIIEFSLMAWLGYMAGRLMGWSPLESLFAGAAVAPSSTMIATRALQGERTDPKLASVIVGILVTQDLSSVLLLAVLTPLAEGAHLSLSGLATTSGNLLGFLVLLLGLGFLLVPRLIRSVVALRSPETLLVTTVGLCFAMALLAQKEGYSVALGAFLAGMLAAESGATATLERLVHPLRDMFSAVFFVAVGMLANPGVLERRWGEVLVLTLIVLAGQSATVSLGAFLSGRSLKTALRAGMSLSQIGEFSFIMVQVGVANGAVGGFLYDVIVAVSVVTAFATPLMIRASEPLARWVDGRLPRPLQTFTALYGSWLEGLKGGGGSGLGRRVRQLVGVLALDTLCLSAIVIAASATLGRWLPALEVRFHLPHSVGRLLWAASALALASPFGLGIFRAVKALGGLLASAAIPTVQEGTLDLGLAPRRALILAFQLGTALAVGLPLLALTQPFLPFGYSPVLLVALVLGLGLAFWRSAVNLQGHVRAGAQMVAEALSRHAPRNQDVLMEEINTIAPGMGAPTSVRVEEGGPTAGKTLAQLNLRSRTGASVIAILRGDERLLMPSGRETVRAGDTVVLVGTQESVVLAKGLLRKPF